MGMHVKAGQLLRTRVECYLWNMRNDSSGHILAAAKAGELCLVLEDLTFYNFEMVSVMFDGQTGFVYAKSLETQ